MSEPLANFDRIARAYRWMEYLSLGTLLATVRGWCLKAGWVAGRREALVLGDGDGRFTARLLQTERQLRVTAVDGSAGMLKLLQRKCVVDGERLVVKQADVRSYHPEQQHDLVVSHFFLDCLTEREVEELVRRVRPQLTENALWVVSEFCVPTGWMRVPASAAIRCLYFAFRVLTGLKVTRLPDYANALRACGFDLRAERIFAGGVLRAEFWGLEEPACS